MLAFLDVGIYLHLSMFLHQQHQLHMTVSKFALASLLISLSQTTNT